jgi:PAS domain S-box-containing protein
VIPGFDRSRLIGRTIEDAFPAITGDGRVMMMNQAMLSALGCSREVVEGRDCLSTFVPDADRPARAEVFTRRIRDRGPTTHENRSPTSSCPR